MGCLFSSMMPDVTANIKDNKCPSDCCNNDRYFCCLKITITDDHIKQIVDQKIIQLSKS